jgi:imidazolonepropionase-like amidohydrolase
MRIFCRFAVFTCAIAQLFAQSAAAADSLYIKAGRLIVEATKPPMVGGAVVITDGVITAVGTDVTAPPGARRIDLSAYTVMPSLLDAHIHLGTVGPQSPYPLPPGEGALRSAPGMKYALENGVAAVRVVGCTDFLDVALQNAIEDGVIPGPHILPSGHALSVYAGHGDHYLFPYTIPMPDFYSPLNGFVSSPDDAEKAVQLQIKYGARAIKLLASGGVGSPLDLPSQQNLTFEEMQRAVHEAHMRHATVAAHAENLTSIMDAMRAGVDSIEHGSELDQEAVDYMKSHGIKLTPTLAVVDTFLEARPDALAVSKAKVKVLAKTHFPSFKLALKNGVFMEAGSDMGYKPGSQTVFDEVIIEVKYGMTPQQAIESATTHAATLMGMEKLGRIAPGMEGDLVAVDGDPLSEIHTVKDLKLVVFKGKVVTDKINSPQTSARPN